MSKRNPNKIKNSKIDNTVIGVSITLLILLVILILFPLLNYFSLSLSKATESQKIILFPRGLTFYSYKYVLTGDEAPIFWRSFGNSVIVTVTVTIVSNLVEAMAAYPLSKRDCPIRGGIMMFFIITMLFSAGVLPIYLLMQSLNLTDSIWSLILISISNVTNLLFFKTFFEGLPGDIEDAARIDGASEIQMFLLIVIPMSLPVVGSCCFFTIVGMWNGYGASLLFINRNVKEARTLAYHIYIMMSDITSKGNQAVTQNPMAIMYKKNIEAASMVLSIIPILCIYPYIINYIKNGLTLGSVKE